MEVEGTTLYNVLSEVQSEWFNSLEELLEHFDDIISYSDCNSMEDVARHYVEESNAFGDISMKIQNYIDYQLLGRDMELEGDFLVTSHGVFEYCR